MKVSFLEASYPVRLIVDSDLKEYVCSNIICVYIKKKEGKEAPNDSESSF
jgi:hypothetical protein